MIPIFEPGNKSAEKTITHVPFEPIIQPLICLQETVTAFEIGHPENDLAPSD